MSVLDVQANFSFVSNAVPYTVANGGGAAATYVAANSYDTSPLAGFLTELTPGDTQLSANTNAFRDLGGGERIWLVVDWVQAAAGGTSFDVQLLTSASSTLSAPNTMLDFGVVVTATIVKGYRQIAALPRSASWLQYLGVQAVSAGTMTGGEFVAWLAKDIDAIVQGYASGFSIK